MANNARKGVKMSEKEIRKLDVRGEICPYPMLKTNEELDSDKDINILEVLTDHSPALSTIPPQALKRGYEVEIDEIDNSEWKITLKKDG
ncbi:MAG: response regulator SirA [Chloroflexi bacterium]|nr:response regulator SirA [Chloroflexota bacterium]